MLPHCLGKCLLWWWLYFKTLYGIYFSLLISYQVGGGSSLCWEVPIHLLPRFFMGIDTN